MMPMALQMAHDTDARTSIRTGTNGQIMPLNIHLNITNAMVSMMASSASCDKKHATAMYMLKTNMSLKCYISHIYQLVHVHI